MLEPGPLVLPITLPYESFFLSFLLKIAIHSTFRYVFSAPAHQFTTMMGKDPVCRKVKEIKKK